jgi:DNA invertase Pin-like site-specific DNA recombinase
MNTALPTGTLIERLRAVKASTRIYYRQSLGEDKQQSIATQEGENKRLAQALGYSDLEWARAVVYSDVDRSGGDFSGREGLTRLLDEAKPGDVIVTWRQDRLGRDMLDASVAIRELVKQRKCHLFTCETGLRPVTMDDASETFMVVARGFGGQSFLENMRKNTRDGLRGRAHDGFASGKVPFGYDTVLVDPTVTDRKKSKKRIVINEKLAPTVRRIFDLYEDACGYRKITKTLNHEGAPSPRGRGWSTSHVWDVLRLPHYAGYWSYGRRRSIGRSGKRTVFEKAAEDQIIHIDRPELAIIPRDQWARVQEQLAKRKREISPQFARTEAATTHMLSGLLRCGGCGGAMRIKICHGRRKDWNKRYYICGRRIDDGKCPNETYVPADDAEAKLIDYLGQSVLARIEQSIRESIRGEVVRIVDVSEARTAELEAMRAEIEDLRRERVRLVRLATATDEPVPEVVEALSVNQGRAKALGEALAVATRPPIDEALAKRLEDAAVVEVQRMRERLTSAEAHEVIKVLVPKGLRFIVGNGLWLIEGAASVPTFRNTDKIRIPDAGDSTDQSAIAQQIAPWVDRRNATRLHKR